MVIERTVNLDIHPSTEIYLLFCQIFPASPLEGLGKPLYDPRPRRLFYLRVLFFTEVFFPLFFFSQFVSLIEASL